MFSASDRYNLREWIYLKGNFQEFLEMLPELVEDAVRACASGEDPELKIAARQWVRIQKRLSELAAWSREFGPGSGCR